MLNSPNQKCTSKSLAVCFLPLSASTFLLPLSEMSLGFSFELVKVVTLRWYNKFQVASKIYSCLLTWQVEEKSREFLRGPLLKRYVDSGSAITWWPRSDSNFEAPDGSVGVTFPSSGGRDGSKKVRAFKGLIKRVTLTTDATCLE